MINYIIYINNIYWFARLISDKKKTPMCLSMSISYDIPRINVSCGVNLKRVTPLVKVDV